MNTRLRAIIGSLVSTFIFILLLLGPVDIFLINIFKVNSGEVRELIGAVLISLVLFVFTAWTLFFKRKGISVVTIMAFPAVTIFPYSVFSDTVVSSVFSGFGQLATSIILVATFWLFSYLLILTANILNGAVIYNIPLGQAGKASQFVFSLISSYLLVAYLNSIDINLFVLVILIGIFIYYWCSSAIWSLRVSNLHVLTASLVIAIIMVILNLALSVWPIPTVYSTVISVIFFYVMLNIGLENRHSIGGAFWLEYVGLISVSLVLLMLFSDWGILGRLI